MRLLLPRRFRMVLARYLQLSANLRKRLAQNVLGRSDSRRYYGRFPHVRMHPQQLHDPAHLRHMVPKHGWYQLVRRMRKVLAIHMLLRQEVQLHL